MTARDARSGDCRRRDFLRAAGATGTAGLAGLSGCLGTLGGSGGGKQLGTYPVEGDSVTFGLSVSRSGPFSATGEEELRGHKLAIKHINEGGGWVDDDAFSALSGDGLLDKTVQYAVRDTAGDTQSARTAALELIQQEDVIMLGGGTTGDTAAELMDVAGEEHVVTMATTTQANTVTGEDCSRYGFREMFNSRMLAQALGPVLRDQFGSDKRFMQFFPQSDRGEELRLEISRYMPVEIGWFATASVPVQVGTSDYRPVFENLPDSVMEKPVEERPDVVFLDLFGLDAANAIRAAKDVLPEKMGKELSFVIPLLDRPTAATAGGALEDVIGTIAWDPAIETPLSESFVSAYQSEYEGGTGGTNSSIPSGPAQVAYTGTLLYADAVARAGTFYPPDVIKRLEGHSYAAGMGKETMRACDHQAIRPVPIVRGRPESKQSFGRYFDLVRDPTRKVGYGCDEENSPAAACSLGPYTPTDTTTGG